MKGCVAITLLITFHLTTATIDLQALKDNASEKLQNLEAKAATTLQQISNSIDLQKIQQYDIFHIIPLLQNGQRALQEKLENIPVILQTKGDILRLYYQKLHSIKGKDVLSLNAIPWPVLRMNV